MKQLFPLVLAFSFVSVAQAQNVKTTSPTPSPHSNVRCSCLCSQGCQEPSCGLLDSWRRLAGGDKTACKPQAFVDKDSYCLTNYRLLPNVDMATIFRDVAKSLGGSTSTSRVWGRPQTDFRHGALPVQLVALMCTDDRYLKAEGVPLKFSKGAYPSTATRTTTSHHRDRRDSSPRSRPRRSLGTGRNSATIGKAQGLPPSPMWPRQRNPPFLILYVSIIPTPGAGPASGGRAKKCGYHRQGFWSSGDLHNRINAELGTQ
jgi:hypothetical protein